MVHRRVFEGKELILGNQGALWGNAMTWWDHDTGTIWSQPLGEAIAGPRKGARLEALPVELTSWGSWQQVHPETVALDAPGGRSGFNLADMSIVLDFDREQVAWRIPALREALVVNDEVAGVPVAVVIDPTDENRWAVFSRRLDDRVVELAVEGDRIIDTDTGTMWDPVRGRALEGPLAGQVLDRLPGFPAFPRDFDTFWPDGRHWPT